MQKSTRRYVGQRLIQWAIVVFVGITIAFFIPRLTPMDPVQQMIGQIQATGQFMDPETVQELEATLETLYGTSGTMLEQYARFWRDIIQFKLGPSLSQFPRPVTDVIGRALPYTIGLMGLATILSWILGLILGSLTGYFYNKKWSRALDVVVMIIYPIPYYIMAFLLLMLFAYIIPIFPRGGASGIGVRPGLNWTFISDTIRHGFLPALSLMIVGLGWRFLSMKAVASTVVGSDYVAYAEAGKLPTRKILFKYVMRNSMLPQITDLALSLGVVFSGTLITEVVFSYPGVGRILYQAILQGDFNLIMGITVFSVVAIATAALVVDLLYPLFDPRIRYN